MASKRETEVSAIPTAKFLQARVTALSTSCIKRLENIFAAALDEDHSTFQAPASSNSQDQNPPPSLTETAVKQLQLDVESAALIRSAEDFMLLTRTLKELWLFGDLATIPQDDEKEVETKEKMKADEESVVQAFLELVSKSGVAVGGVEEVEEQETTIENHDRSEVPAQGHA